MLMGRRAFKRFKAQAARLLTCRTSSPSKIGWLRTCVGLRSEKVSPARRLSDDGNAANGLSQLTTSLGMNVQFVSPEQRLTINVAGNSSPKTLELNGLDAQFAGGLRMNAGVSGQIDLTGNIYLRGGDFRAGAGTIAVSGTLASNHATIDLAAGTSLTVTAEGVIDNTAGRVFLDAGEGGALAVSGRIDVSVARPGQVGGTVHLLGREVRLEGQATIDASGRAGGGTVLVGGDYQGMNPLVRRATNTFVGGAASISANALENGQGGKIIVWADEAAIVAGSGNLQARGGALGGNGGFIETSGKRYLALGGAADAGSPLGLAGTWLLDPFNVEIVAGSGGTIPANGNFTAGANTTIGADTLETALKTTNVTIYTGTGGNDADGNITVSSEISVALGNNKSSTLTLNAAHNILVNANITATSGSLNVVLNANSTAGGQADPDTDVGSVTVSGAITTNDGSFTSTGIDFANSGAIAAGDGAVTITHTGDVTLGANITTTAAAAVTTTGGDIAFDGGATLTADLATLTAAGTITADEAGTDINTSGGAITLNGTGGIGTNSRAITIAGGGAGVVTATAGNASIFLESTTDLNLGVISTGAGANTVSIAADDVAGLDISIGASSSTDDNWSLLASGNITFNGAFRLTAASASLDAGGTITERDRHRRYRYERQRRSDHAQGQPGNRGEWQSLRGPGRRRPGDANDR